MTGMARYLKAAFLNRWNLLAVFGGLAFAVLSGMPDVVGALVLASETAYLAFLGTHPKFQKYVDAQEAAANRQQRSRTVDASLRQILQSLPAPTMSRFDRLRDRCLQLRRIAGDLQKTRDDATDAPLDSIQVSNFDRLLWMFLRLLFTQHALGKFLAQTSAEAIRRDMAELEKKLATLPAAASSPHAGKLRATVEDNLATCHDRLANYERAKANFELVELEIDRLENKITSLAEIGVNRTEPDFISTQVNQVAGSLLDTEKAINELQFATGLGPIDDDVPELIERGAVVEIR